MAETKRRKSDIMKVIKRIAALLGVILLVGMYVLTLISGIFARPESGGLFRVCIYCSITVPCLLYGFELIYRVLRRREEQEQEDEGKN